MDNTKFEKEDTDTSLGDITELFKTIAEQAKNDERLQRMLNPDDDEWS